MLGSGEILIILIILAFFLVPYFQRRSQQRIEPRKPTRKVKSYHPPEARDVDYEDE